MSIKAHLPSRGRDLRLDLFRGVANWAIFLDHIPNNAVNWITTRNWGFSDAADLFVFISGYTASFVYARIMIERGFIVGATRLFKRVWQLYVAHVLLFVIYISAIGWVALRYMDPQIIHEFNIAGVVDSPIQTMTEGLLLRFKPLNLDVLPLYIVLMAFFAPVLWLLLRAPDLTMMGSITLYLAARHFGWNLPSYPAGTWYFNPFCWQLLFVFGAWFALGGTRVSLRLIRSRTLLVAGALYLVFALLMTMAGRFPEFGELFPAWLVDFFNPNDKTNLAPYRFLHFVVIAFFGTRFVRKDWKGLEWKMFDPLIKCGQQSLQVFCVGVFLSFVAHFILMISYGTLWMQIGVSVGGLAIMTAVAYYADWSKKQDKPLSSRAAPAAVSAATGQASAGQISTSQVSSVGHVSHGSSHGS